MAPGLRLFIETARGSPLFAGFIRATGMEAAGPASLFHEYLPGHLSGGIGKGRFVGALLRVLLDLIAGGVLTGSLRQTAGPMATAPVWRVVAAILHALGLPAD